MNKMKKIIWWKRCDKEKIEKLLVNKKFLLKRLTAWEKSLQTN
jgi:hypothetical protein